ncbi:unnamed protein product [Cylindrotheca closterium]|uniref:Uncharacterized protein n=1 Tax=Cylindrotheca closterium TaxID=2856 RepID=A0AAD2CLP2_9STRA|nr:unnamed protein product [Cylindrotheca closterium]
MKQATKFPSQEYAVSNALSCASSCIMRRQTRYRVLAWFSMVAMILSFLPFAILPEISPEPPAISLHRPKLSPPTLPAAASCALCFFGLPRSFELFVLPSIIENILKTNKGNRCDIYFHYYDVKEEQKNVRSGSGGQIDVQAVEKLREAVKDVYGNDDPNLPFVSIISDTESEFLSKRGQLMEKYRKTKAKDGKYLYFPWMAKSFVYPTSIDNIVKQWHSIDAVWKEMELGAAKLQKEYAQVAMLRNDVMYVTPFDIYNTSRTTKRGAYHKNNNLDDYVGVPAWARFPINDRMIYGSYKGVKIWSTERFQRLEDHVLTYEPGYGMHSERFLNHSIFPAIRDLGIQVVENPDLCFFRARADGSVWISDCATRNGAARGFRKMDTQRLVENIIGKSCQKSKYNRVTLQLHCNNEPQKNR